MDKPVLVVLAAGMGSRYGGMKQLDPVGPGGQIIIDYSTGANWADTDSGNEKTADISAADDSDAENGEDQEPKEQTYILNKNTKKFHKPECSSVDDIKAENKSGFTGTREELIEDGFDPCGKCRP